MYRRAQLGIASREIGSVSLLANPPVARRRVEEPTRTAAAETEPRPLGEKEGGKRGRGGENKKDLEGADTTDRSDYALHFRTTTRSYASSDDRGAKLYLARNYSR